MKNIIHKQYVEEGMSLDEATTIGQALLRNRYGESAFAGYGDRVVITKRPVEWQLVGIEGSTAEEARLFIKEDMERGIAAQGWEIAETLGLKDSARPPYRIVADDQTESEIQRGGRPDAPISYSLWFRTESGYAQAYDNDTGKPVRYTVPTREEVQELRSYKTWRKANQAIAEKADAARLWKQPTTKPEEPTVTTPLWKLRQSDAN